MGKKQARKSNTGKNKAHRKMIKTKHRIKDLDQIAKDLEPENAEKLLHQEEDDDLPGLGQYYCIHCARYFIEENALEVHYKTKEHKKRVKRTKEIPYTQKEAEMCAGLLPSKR